MERHLLADRQAQITAALTVGAEDYEPLDIAAAIERWAEALAADPTNPDDPAVLAVVAELLKEAA